MGTSTTTTAVYINVIEDVIKKVSDEFINNGGPGESVLNELQRIWEMKMMQAGVLSGPIERSSAQKPTPGGPLTHDLNVPYEGTEEYETPTAEMLFPPTPLQTPLPTPLPGTADNSSMYNIPTGSTDYPTPASDNGNTTDLKGRPSPSMPSPSPWANPRLDVNIAYMDGRDEAERRNPNQQLMQDFLAPSSGKRKRDEFSAQYRNNGSLPQQDGANDDLPKFQANDWGHMNNVTNRKVSENNLSSNLKIPQVDGPITDPYDEMLSTPNIYSYQDEAKTPAPNGNTPVAAQNDAVDEDDEELLNEDDDDDELDGLDSDDDMNTQHLVLAQFDKVTRTKSRWKCTLKDGIMHINDKDVLFNKATGEFEF